MSNNQDLELFDNIQKEAKNLFIKKVHNIVAK